MEKIGDNKLFTFNFEYTVFENDSLIFTNEGMKEIANSYSEFIEGTELDDIDVFREFISDFLFDELPCYIGDITNSNIEEFYNKIKNICNNF